MGSYIFVNEGHIDYWLRAERGLPPEACSSFYRASLIYVKDHRVAQIAAQKLQHDHGTSEDWCEDYIEFEAIPKEKLSDKDIVLCADVGRKSRPKQIKEWVGKAQKVVNLLQKDFGGVMKRKNVKKTLGVISSQVNKTNTALKTNTLTILKVLNEKTFKRYSEYEIEAACGITRKTIRKHLKILVDYKFAHKPNGPKGGVAITPKGQAILEKQP